MAIKAVCECGKKFEAKDEYEGRRAICPSCKREFVFQRGGIPVFQEVVEPPPLLPIQVDDDDDQCQPEPPPRPEPSRPFWKDPIVVIGAAVPTAILTVFFVYLYFEHKTKEFHRHVYELKLEIDDLVKSRQSRAALDKCKEMLVLIGEPATGDFKMRGYADVARKTRDRLHLAVQAEIKEEEASRQATKRNSRIPVEVSYPVIDEVFEPPIKHGLSVRLNTKVTPEVLREIALELKSQETTRYELTYLFYYLPGNGPKMGDGYDDPWASAEFRPTLDVEILGLTPDKERALLSAPHPECDSLIGRWVEEAMGGTLYTIYQTGGSKYLNQRTSPSGRGHSVELVEVIPGRRFERREESRAGDHYVINDRGELELRDREGLIGVAKPANR
jgi:hypothetical protein